MGFNSGFKGLIELFTATGKLPPPNWRFSMCAPRMTRHTSIRYSSSCHTRVNMGASIFFTAAMIRAFRSATSRRRVLCVLCTKCTLHSNHRLTRVIFQHTKRPFSHYIHLHRLAAEMWTTMKNNLLEKNWAVPSICTGFVNTCPTVFL